MHIEIVLCFRVIALIFIIITVIRVIMEICCIVIIFWWLICTRSQLAQVGALQLILDTSTIVLNTFIFAIT